MPVVTTYPGVYIEEIPSGSVTISGVATSITAFVGRAMMGPATPTYCFSFGDFENIFGGRAYDFPMSYAVEDFFLNGGIEAIIVRVEAATPSADDLAMDAPIQAAKAQAAKDAADKANTQAGTTTQAQTDAQAALDAANAYVAAAKAAQDALATPPDPKQSLANAVTAGKAANGPAAAQTPTPPPAVLAAEAAGLVSVAARAKASADVALAAATAVQAKAADADKAGSTPATKAALTAANTLVTNKTKAQGDAQKALTAANAYRAAALLALPGGPLMAAYEAGKAAGSPNVPTPATASAAASAQLATDGWVFTAANNGKWGDNLTLAIDTTGVSPDVATRYGSTVPNTFNITLTYTKPNKSVIIERFGAVNIDDTPYRVDRVLKQQSNLARLIWPSQPPQAPGVTPKDNPISFNGGIDGPHLAPSDLLGDEGSRTGLYALEDVDLFNLLCLPWDERNKDWSGELLGEAANYCVKRRAMLIVDSPDRWVDLAKTQKLDTISPVDIGIGTEAQQRNSMVYFPKVMKADPEMGGRPDVFPPCGIIAGQIAQTDVTRGVWKAPAGTAAGIGGILGLQFNLTDMQQGLLNPLGINCLRSFRVLGPLVWGARTLRGADLMADDYKYVPVRRLTLYIEESLYRGTKFAVFEPNDETLWSQLRLAVGGFMADLSRQGAFYGYDVACDKTTTTPYEIERGVCNVRVAFAPVKPAEFIVLQIQQQTAAQVTA